MKKDAANTIESKVIEQAKNVVFWSEEFIQKELTGYNHEELDAHDHEEKADKEDLSLMILSQWR